MSIFRAQKTRNQNDLHYQIQYVDKHYQRSVGRFEAEMFIRTWVCNGFVFELEGIKIERNNILQRASFTKLILSGELLFAE